MWDHHKIPIKTHFGRMISMKKDGLVKNRIFHDFFPKSGDFLNILALILAPYGGVIC